MTSYEIHGNDIGKKTEVVGAKRFGIPYEFPFDKLSAIRGLIVDKWSLGGDAVLNRLRTFSLQLTESLS